MTNFLKLVAVTATIALFATSAHAEFGDSDSDKDGKLSMEEYDKDSMDRSKKTFASYDTNKDGNVDENEFRAGDFKRYDSDGDGGINNEEYDRDVSDSKRFEED